MKNLSSIFKKFSRGMQQSDSLKQALRIKYSTFQNLLAENNHVLRLMADMEEKLSGEYLFDGQYIHSNVQLISDATNKIIQHLNAISHDKYLHLFEIYNQIQEELERTFAHKAEIAVSDLTIPLEKLVKEMSNIAGGKIAHLGEMKNRLNLLIPEGFSISAYAFKRFMGHNDFIGKINSRLSAISIDNLEELNETSKQIQDMIESAEIPEDLQDAVQREYRELCQRISRSDEDASLSPHPPFTKGEQGEIMVSVRSSAIYEDGESSFAGQYATFLNVPEESILQKYKEVVASLFTPQALFYCKTKGFSEEDMVMAVGVLRMVNAKAGGVMYTRDPNDPEKKVMIINAVWGLGNSVVDGTENAQSFIVEKETGGLLEQRISQQQRMVICTPETGTRESNVRDSMKVEPCLTGEEIKMLFRHACTLENHYGRPQDIEWAIDRNNRIYILQSRPLRIRTFDLRHSPSSLPRRVEGYHILIDRGVIACKGVGSGKAFVLEDEGDLKDFPEGAVLVARHTSPKFVTIMNKAAAIITDVGSAAGHMASLSREYGIPTILETEVATCVIKNGQELTVDAVNGNVYEGRVGELLKYSSKERETFKGTHLFVILEKVLKFIVPLNLVDPDHENFKPECCETFHDITRFCHEMAMAEIFKTGKGQAIESFEDLMSAITFAEEGEAGRLGSQTSALRAGIPINAHLLDIDGGIKKNLKKVTPIDISSIPFSAFLKGLMSMRWPEPRPVDVKGFLGMVAHTASMREEELHRLGGKSYAIISAHYMNFSIRLGYHFSMVEAYAGENMNDNYIKFFFKGGGAATDRRLRRVRLINEILKKMDFKVTVIEDVIDAMLTKYKQSTIEEKLEMMGRLTVYTKQLDMVMYNDAVTDMFVEDFIRDHMKVSKPQ